MKLKAILFDLDNTLLDFIGMKEKASYKAAGAMIEAGLPADKVTLSKQLFDFYLEYGIESDDAFEQYLLREFEEAPPRVLAAALNAYLREKYLHLTPYPGVPETVEELRERGLKLGVVSDGVRLKAWMRLNAAGLDTYFDTVVTFEDTGKKKPAPEPFQKACENLGVKPEECLMVGDWPERDIVGAKNLGMFTCLAAYGHHIGEGTGDYEIAGIKDLIQLVERLQSTRNKEKLMPVEVSP